MKHKDLFPMKNKQNLECRLQQIFLGALTHVMLNPYISCLCKQCSSRSVGFWRNTINCEFIATIRIKHSDWLKVRSGRGILIYSAWQGLRANIRKWLNTKRVEHPSCVLGSDPGAATRMKLIVNMVMGSVVASLAEAMAMAEKVGLDQEDVAEVLTLGSLNCPTIAHKSQGNTLFNPCPA